MLSLIDGDVLKYSCGFASDAQAKKDGTPYQPLSFCLHGVNKMIDSIVSSSGGTEYGVFLSHPINHRHSIFPEYKANRDPTHRPYWFKDIERYLVDRHGAQFSEEGDEADDALGIAQCSGDFGDTVICTVDKDLDMIPGLHYNWSKLNRDKGVYRVSERDGEVCFYKQIIKGDVSDNIPGLYKFRGVKASSTLLSGVEDCRDAAEMYQYVLSLFGGDWEFVQRSAHLMWIKRDAGGWNVPE